MTSLALESTDFQSGAAIGNTALIDPLPGSQAIGPAVRSRPSLFIRTLRRLGKLVATLGIAGVAIVLCVMTWQYYVMSPWTRNGAIRVQVANVASQVSGQITQVPVVDNQYVRQGDILYVVDPINYEIAVHLAQAQVDQAAADYQVKQAQSDRRQHLGNEATTPEEQQSYAGIALQAKAAYDGAAQQLAMAKINLARTKVTSPVNGYVTNLLLRVGDFAVQGASNISVVDADSFWIDGYFEETKLSQICVGDRAEAKLMSYAEPIIGHIDTITRGIAVSNAGAGVQGLPNVDPVYTWVQLAQRVPVRVAIDKVPKGIPLVSGMTATVTVKPAGNQTVNWLGALGDRFTHLPELFHQPMPRPGCAGTALQGAPLFETLPATTEPTAGTPEQIDLGLVPGIDQSPKMK